jgi:hypothetical protein
MAELRDWHLFAGTFLQCSPAAAPLISAQLVFWKSVNFLFSVSARGLLFSQSIDYKHIMH